MNSGRNFCLSLENMVQAKRAGVWGTLGLKTARYYLPKRSMGPSMWGEWSCHFNPGNRTPEAFVFSFSMASKAGEGWVQWVQCAQPLSHVRLLCSPFVALQAPMSMEFSRQEYWSKGLPWFKLLLKDSGLPMQGAQFPSLVRELDLTNCSEDWRSQVLQPRPNTAK